MYQVETSKSRICLEQRNKALTQGNISEVSLNKQGISCNIGLFSIRLLINDEFYSAYLCVLKSYGALYESEPMYLM